MIASQQMLAVSAHNHSSEIIFDCIKEFYKIYCLRHKARIYVKKGIFDINNKKAKKYQRKWKEAVQNDKNRREDLEKMWNNKVSDLIMQYLAKGREKLIMVTKLQGLKSSKRNEAISKYIRRAKEKYIMEIKEWLKKRKEKPVILFIYLYFIQFSKATACKEQVSPKSKFRPKSKDDKYEEARKEPPKYQFFPTPKVLTDLIQKAALT